MRPLRVMSSLVFAVLLLSSAAVVWGAPRLQDGGAAPQVVQTDPALNGKFYIHDDISFYFDQIMDHDSVEAAFSVEPAVVGTLVSSMSVHARARETLLPILLMPVVLPVLISAVRGTNALLNELPSEDWMPWLQLLVIADLLYLAAAYWLFDFVVEE